MHIVVFMTDHRRYYYYLLALLQRLLDAHEVIALLPQPTKVSRSEQPPSTEYRIVDASSLLDRSPALLLEELGELLWTHELGVGVRSGRDESQDVFCHRDGEELREGGSGDGRDE